MTKPESPMQDPDMLKATDALVRASKRARKLAEQTGTEFVVIRDGQLVIEIPQPSKSAEDSSDPSSV